MRSSHFLFCCILATAASALDAKEARLHIDAADFDERRAKIEAALDDPTQYVEMGGTERNEVRASLQRMGALLERAGSVEDLNPEARLRVFNEQEIINTRLAGAAEKSRLICRTERSTGSNLRQRRCRTVGEIEREREESKDGWRRISEQRLPPPDR